MHANFIDLNKVWLEESYRFPKIDKLMDSIAIHAMLSFTDAFFGYRQIPLLPDDEGKNAFITDKGLYYYKVMAFEVKSVGVLS